jgi:hypothetical protein
MAGLLDEPYIGYPQLRRRSEQSLLGGTPRGLLNTTPSADTLRKLGEQLINIPTSATRAITDPQLFSRLLGITPNQQLSGFSAGYAGLPAKPPSDIGVVDPLNREYSKGYSSGEEMGMMTALAAPLAPLARPVGRAVGEQAYRMTEDMLQSQGLMPSIVPRQSPFVPNVEAGQEMIVKHNLTPEKLMAADRLGAMPVPSLGITKTKYDDPLSAFGDITLVGSKEMAIPSRANPVYSADAYTVRRPDIYTKTDEKANKFLREKLSEPYGSLAKESDVMGEISGTLQNLDRNLENSTLLKTKYLETQGLLPNPSEFKTARDFRMAVRNDFNQLPQEELIKFYDWQPEYIAQLREEAIQAGGTVTDQLFKGRSPTGKELYKPATVENIVKEMANKKPGDEGNFFTAGSLRGKLVPKLSSEKDIQKSRDKIISNSAFEAFKDDISNTHNKLNSELNRFLVENKSGVNANTLLEEIALGTTNKYEYSRELAKKVPQDLKDRILAYAKELKEAPTGYFEIKPKRAMSIGEFKGAIVPSDVSPKTMSILEKNGIKEIYKYSNIDERKSLIQKFGKEMFSAVPLVGAATVDGLLD